MVDGIPVLINDARSLFRVDEFRQPRSTFPAPERSGIKELGRRLFRSNTLNLNAGRNFGILSDLLRERTDAPATLVLGGRTLGEGIGALVGASSIETIETDVAFGPRTQLICDAHDIPFRDGTFDAVVVQAVLEHVLDPWRCVEEIARVLKDRGLVYSEVPFMQQVHGGQYDFHRFTDLGHRRLFRQFKEIDRGVACGPGTALAWSYQRFLMSFARSRRVRAVIALAAVLTSFYLKYFDRYLGSRAGAMDAASGYYFLGEKAQESLSDAELIESYRGASRLGHDHAG